MEKLKYKRKEYAEIIFYMIFIVWFTVDFIYGINIFRYNWSKNTYYLRLLSVIKYLLIFYIILFQNFTVKEWGLVGAISVVFFISGRISGMYDLFYIWLFIVAAKGKDTKKILLISVALSLLYIPGTVVSALTGIIDNSVVFRNEIARYSLGFQHPNQFGFRLFFVLAGFFFIRKNKFSFGYSIIAVVLMVFAWEVLNSRTTVICIFSISLLFFFERYFNQFCLRTRSILFSLMILITICAMVLPVVLSFLYTEESTVLGGINHAMSGRLGLSKRAIDEFGISMFGQQIFVTATERAQAGLPEEIIIDISYINILLRAGIICYALYGILYICSIIHWAKAGCYIESAVLMIMSLYGVIELMPAWAMWNPFLILIANVFNSDGNSVSANMIFSFLKKKCQKK